MQYLADEFEKSLPPRGHPLRKLGVRLAELLDEDQWAECERLLLEGWEHDAGHAAAKAETAAAVAKERERASVLYDMLLNRPELNTGLESEYLAWTSKCYRVIDAYKAAIRAGAKGPSDADQA